MSASCECQRYGAALCKHHPHLRVFVDRFEHLSKEQMDKVPEMRTALASTSHGLVNGIDDDHSLLRFLKAREFDVPKAVAMYEVSDRPVHELAPGSAFCTGRLQLTGIA